MYSYETRIRYSELDEKGQLKIDALLDYFQDCSIFHSEDLGLGVAYLKERHMAWVMSSWQIVVERYPHLGEYVTVGTAPYEFKGFIGYRNFLMSDREGKWLCYANTIWSLIDTDSGRPVKPPAEMRERYVLEPRLSMEYAARKIDLPGEMRPGAPVTVKAHHLDTNHHVNNVQYVKIAMEGLEKDIAVRQLRAEYKKQAHLNDILIPHTALAGDDIYVVVLKNPEGEVCCIVELKKG